MHMRVFLVFAASCCRLSFHKLFNFGVLFTFFMSTPRYQLSRDDLWYVLEVRGITAYQVKILVDTFLETVVLYIKAFLNKSKLLVFFFSLCHVNNFAHIWAYAVHDDINKLQCLIIYISYDTVIFMLY